MSPKSFIGRSYAETLSLSQQTTQFLENYDNPSFVARVAFFWHKEAEEIWTKLEKSFIACLLVGDDKAAYRCLDRLINRFGAEDERVIGLQGLYKESVAQDQSEIEEVLKDYNNILTENPANLPVSKRQIALLRDLGQPSEAINAIVQLLEVTPTDIESWAELCELYFSLGLYPQASFCLEEVLLLVPNAWTVHARLGEILFVSAKNAKGNYNYTLAESIRRFCRSIELCENFFRGIYGLKLASDRLLETLVTSDLKPPLNLSPNIHESELLMPSRQSLKIVNEAATARLAQLIPHPEKYNLSYAEVIAARKILGETAKLEI